MNTTDADFRDNSESLASFVAIRERLVNYILIACAVGGLPAILMSLPRSLEFGFKPIQHYMHAMYLLLVVLALFRNRIPFLIRAGFLLGAAFLASLLSLHGWGLIGMYSIFMMVTIFLGVVFLGIRGGIVIAIVVVISEGVIALLVYQGVITFDFDFNAFSVAPNSWIVSVSHIAVFAVLLILCFGYIKSALTNSIEMLEHRTHELESASSAMKQESMKRRVLEGQLVQSQKMEAIGRLAGGVAHDFNNQLMVIINMSEMLLLRLPKGDPGHRQAQMIKEAGEKSAELTNQLLAFSRKQVIEPAVISLNNSLLELKRMLSRMIGEDIKLEIRLEDAPWPVLIDPTQVEQVIINLVVNARDAMPSGGLILLETKNLYLDQGYADSHAEIEPGEYLELSVSDTGIGMDRETISHIFEPFFTTKGKDKGTGLGLSMVYGIVKQAGGNIGVYSEPGSGTTFKVYLPRVREQIEDKKIAAEKSVSLEGTETVLVVEDEELVLQSTLMVLSDHGYQVIKAANGEAALKYVQENDRDIDIMVTDVIMTGINGKDLALKMAEIRPAIKVLFVSGYADDVIVHHGVLERGTPFLQKPFNMNQLLLKLREILDSN